MFFVGVFLAGGGRGGRVGASTETQDKWFQMVPFKWLFLIDVSFDIFNFVVQFFSPGSKIIGK